MQRFGKPEPRIKKSDVDQILTLAKPGMGLLSHEDFRVTNDFIKGFWDHVVIVTPKMTIVEAVGDNMENVTDEKGEKSWKNFGGVREVDLEEWLYKKDDVALFDVLLPLEIKVPASANSLSFIGQGYDYSFDLFNKAKKFCSGLVFYCYYLEKKDFMIETIKENQTIIPQDFYDLAVTENGFKLLYDSRHNV